MYIDMHSHLAWGIDDGLETEDEAREALQQAKHDGIDYLVATPHLVPGSELRDMFQSSNSRIKELSELAKEYDITVCKGAELYMNAYYLDMIDQHQYHSLNGSRFILIEFDVRSDMNDNEDVEDMIYELKLRGLKPVIAHVERYFPNKLDIERIKAWIDEGCCIQVNRTSILGMNGTQCEKIASKLLKKGLVHVIASDAHRITGNRICKLSDVYQKVEKMYGTYNAELLCHDNPDAMIKAEDIKCMQLKTGFFKRIFKRGD